jgi:hypothetical protein
MNRYFEYHFIRFDRKVRRVILKTKDFYTYSLFALLLIECFLSFQTEKEYYSWKLYDLLVITIQCSIFIGLREFYGCYLHKKCVWQKTTSIGLIVNGCLELYIKKHQSDFEPCEFTIYIQFWSVLIITVLTIIALLTYEQSN